MIRNLLSLFLAASVWAASAATLSPVQLLNPAGSASGQAIISTGPSTPPGWGAVPLTGVTGTLPIANGGTNATTASAARANLGTPSTGPNTFSGSQTINASSAALTINDSSGTNSARVYFQSGGVSQWDIGNAGFSSNSLSIDRYNSSGTYVDTPITISNSTGVTMFNQRPIFGSATPWDNSNLPSPASTTGATFTGAITPSQTNGIVGTTTNNNANAGSVGEFVSSTSGSISLTNGVITNVTTISLTAGDWDVSGVVKLTTGAGDTVTFLTTGVSTTSATYPSDPFLWNDSTSHGSTSNFTAIAPIQRLSLSATTTVYLVVGSNHSGGTLTGVGNIRARRMR